MSPEQGQGSLIWWLSNVSTKVGERPGHGAASKGFGGQDTLRRRVWVDG